MDENLKFSATFKTTAEDTLQFALFYGYQQEIPSPPSPENPDKKIPNPQSPEDFVCDMMNAYLAQKLNSVAQFYISQAGNKQIDEQVQASYKAVSEALKVTSTPDNK